MTEQPENRKPDAAPSLVGRKFGRLTIVGAVGRGGKWDGLCDCGSRRTVHGCDLRRGRIKSCGCLQREKRSRGNPKHGHATGGTSRTYSSWCAMRSRCTNPSVDNYSEYGGRGIRVCDRWLNSFEAFLEDMGERPDGTSLERIDYNGNYEPSNCTWATRTEQSRNRRPNRKVSGVCECCGQPYERGNRLARFCSNACNQRYSRATRKVVERELA